MESRKTTGFLLGLIVALTLCFAALEYTSRAADDEETEDALETFDEDMMDIPTLDQKDMVAAEQKPKDVPVVAEELNEVSDMAQDMDVNVAENDKTTNGNDAMTAEVIPEKVEYDVSSMPPLVVDKDDNPLSWRVVEELPEFPGGMAAFMKWLTKNLKYPASARSRKIQGKVVVQFVINKDGTICDAKVLQALDPALDREALRVVGMMPEWKPGRQQGKICRTLFVIPIIFKI